MDSPAARAILRALAECWPEEADLEKVVVQEKGSRELVVTVWTSNPGRVIGHGGDVSAEMRDRLRKSAPHKAVQFRVRPREHPAEPEGQQWGDVLQAGALGRDLVPNLVGMTVGEAHDKASFCGFSLATADPDGAPMNYSMAHGPYEDWVVMAQNPRPGVLATLHSQIVVSVEERGGGGEAGDREPRVPPPSGGIVEFELPIDAEVWEYLEEVE